jgi:nitrite reductase/ring-hydroxylating ferredoxin subunit
MLSGDRRHFIKALAWTTVCSTLAGKTWTDSLAAEILPLSTSGPGALRLTLAEFPALLQPSGSVRLGVNPLRGTPPNGPMPNGAFYPVIINRDANDNFFALNSRCTHQGCVVDPLDPTDNRMTCPCHGSIYAIDGRRLSGPAPSALTRYTTALEGNETLVVQIPNLGFSVTASTVQPGSAGRLRLTFSALRNIEYQVRFRASWDGAATAIPFATGPESALDQNSFTATANAVVSLYVERNSPHRFLSGRRTRWGKVMQPVAHGAP